MATGCSAFRQRMSEMSLTYLRKHIVHVHPGSRMWSTWLLLHLALV